MKVYIVGIGMDGVGTLTQNALGIIKSADVLIGASRMLEPFLLLDKQTFCSWKSEEIKYFISTNSFENVVILMSGDCGFFSGAKKLVCDLSDYDTEIISGISSLSYFCSKVKKPWQSMNCISLHGVEGNIIRNVCRNEYCFFLLGGDVSAQQVCRLLCEYGMGNVKVYIGENLSYEEERISSGLAENFVGNYFDTLSVMITENNNFEKSVPCGISDDMFLRGSVPMTKSEIRCVAVSKLDICQNDICWDIGCGTGSVSVEIALKCFDGMVYAIDRNDEAVKLTDKNAHRFRCDNIRVTYGTAPECLEILPVPDKVFIGGSCGKIKEILEVVFSKNPFAEIVITVVSLETLSTAINAFESLGIENTEVTQIAVTRTKKIGKHTMLSAENPVFILKGIKS